MSKTTLAGIAVILIAVLAQTVNAFDDDPTTKADWTQAMASVATGLGLVFASDQKGGQDASGQKL